MHPHQFQSAVQQWFEKTYGTPTEPQALGWPAIQAGRHVLISAPTGSGKTLAAFLASLDALFRQALAGTLADETQVLYVSPLKALSNDIQKNLQEPLEGIRAALLEGEQKSVEVRTGLRTGDTPAAHRQALLKKPPHILVTTPESFYLLLTSVSGRKMLSTVRTIIVDEIHAVADDRRGAHLALSMERLAALTGKPLQRIGLSATQKPIEEVASFLIGAAEPLDACEIVNVGHRRRLDVAIEVPGSPLEAVMSNEVWEEVYRKIAALVQAHRTTLIFVNTRRMAERVTRHLGELLEESRVTSHHGSLSAALRLEAENRLKRGELRALVATASLELGIDIGAVDLVCQIGSTRSISAFLQRAGRAEHKRGGTPKARLFPLTRDDLVECTALVNATHQGELDRLLLPDKPLDVLAQQLVAEAASIELDEQACFQMVCRAWPYRHLDISEFNEVVQMLSQGFSTKRGRRGALLHHDAVNGRIRGRRGARLSALTSGGAIPDNSDYRVVLDISDTFIGTINEDFAVESMAGDIFQLGNASWRILRINAGSVRVEDAQGQPPGIPFWLGEAPGRTDELSRAVSDFRREAEQRLQRGEDLALWMEHTIPRPAAEQLAAYFTQAYHSLGAMPSQETLILERFFDDSGGMQLVLHSTHGSRINRAWGLALRKRFCRSFNFELQAAATEDAIVISLGTQHSFPLEEVFHYLHSNTVRDLLIQALLDAPMFTIRWRWNASRALAVPRFRGGKKTPAPLLRMDSENLLAAVFPDQLACLEHIEGDREIPEHPLVRQTIKDCLTEAMDIEGLEAILRRLEKGEVTLIARDLPEPSPLAHEILNAKPYAFLDNAPLEERRTQAVYTRRATEPMAAGELGVLDAAAIERVRQEAWPQAQNADELHDALLLAGCMTEEEVFRTCTPGTPDASASTLLNELQQQRRIHLVQTETAGWWVPAERLQLLSLAYPEFFRASPPQGLPGFSSAKTHEEALRELVRGRLEISGPVAVSSLASLLQVSRSEVDTALAALEGEGFAMRGRFSPGAVEPEWCDRRLLARIHRLTLDRLRAEIQPVSPHDFMRFLFEWQHVGEGRRLEGPEGLAAVLEQLDGYELPLAAWEPEVLSARVAKYEPQWLDRLSFSGRVGWGRFTAPQTASGRGFSPLRSSPMALYLREHLEAWLSLAKPAGVEPVSHETQKLAEMLGMHGAQFFHELARATGLLPVQLEKALAELAALGWVTADSFDGLRALLLPPEKRARLGRQTGLRSRRMHLASVEFSGRWSLLKRRQEDTQDAAALELYARTLLHRYGVMFRRLLEREPFGASWYELGRIYRRWEARGEIRGGHFISSVSGEQFALPEAIAVLRTTRKAPKTGELLTLSAADPLNLQGVLLSGPKVSALSGNRLLFQDALPIAALEGGQVKMLAQTEDVSETHIHNSLKIRRLAIPLRPYYA